ncbi:uncharacterized protein I206_107775 [Kwoniella pini CBS 10737]|uniref:Altered inheritance of mitochondria protein 6 n=1 Tax=Kwoniella pini CBS 10737 TaxID=1296096 RepID=A0A1B9HY98_9TREE|nr:uncharacterized protein I206_06108 [Kwoniella pini CBS 10737]OCF48240.1 hypothetical protein I206_06108 [Kwoniella pini CBS 10737]
MIMANSHNDEMQGNDALELALGLGYGFIEIDTYLARNPDSAQSDENKGTELNRNFTLLAGHDVKDLKSSRTLKKYYFDPLLNILDKNNKNRTLVSNGTGNVWKGIYKNDSDKEVTIFIDMKRDGELIWPYLLDLLQPFISKDYLTYYNVSSSEWSYGPLKIIGTGLTPLNRVYYSSIRYVFYDAPLTKLNKPFKIEKSLDGPEVNNIEWDKTISPIASSKLPLKYIISTFFSFKSNTNKGNCKLKSIHLIAREKGIQSRWWGYSNNPNWLKVKLWNVLRNSGQDILNTDYLIQSKNWLNDREKQTRNLYKC